MLNQLLPGFKRLPGHEGQLAVGQVIAKVVLSIVLVPLLITLGVAAARTLDPNSGTAAPTLH